MGKTVKKISTLEILYGNACGYRETFYRSTINALENNSVIVESNRWSSIFINGLFSIEIFTKYMYAFNHIKNDKIEYYLGHNFYYLYKELSRKQKSKITNELNSIGCSKDKFVSFKRKLKGINKNYDPIGLRYFDEDNKYLYKLDINLLIYTVEALYLTCKNMRDECFYFNSIQNIDKKFYNKKSIIMPITTKKAKKIINKIKEHDNV